MKIDKNNTDEINKNDSNEKNEYLFVAATGFIMSFLFSFVVSNSIIMYAAMIFFAVGFFYGLATKALNKIILIVWLLVLCISIQFISGSILLLVVWTILLVATVNLCYYVFFFNQ